MLFNVALFSGDRQVYLGRHVPSYECSVTYTFGGQYGSKPCPSGLRQAIGSINTCDVQSLGFIKATFTCSQSSQCVSCEVSAMERLPRCLIAVLLS